MPSFQTIDRRDLGRLARLARSERDELFERHPEWGQRYRSGLLFTILTGPSANHYISGQSGFTAFDLLSFFAEPNGRRFPQVRRAGRDYGPSRHGREPGAPATYRGRQVWLAHHPIQPRAPWQALELLQAYILAGRTPTARRLRASSAVFIEPEPLLGLVAWPALAVIPKSATPHPAATR